VTLGCAADYIRAGPQTPDDGISVHPEAALKSSFVNEDGPRDSRPALGFFKTVIEFERAVTHYWPLLTAGTRFASEVLLHD
jgi:hypothetical protein